MLLNLKNNSLITKVGVLSEKLNFSESDKEQKLVMWEEKWHKLEKQLNDKNMEIKRLQERLEKCNDTMFERHNDLMRSSQQFIQAKDAIDHENVALKKNYENAIKTIEKLKEELQSKNELVIELKTKAELVEKIIENGNTKSEEEIKSLWKENSQLKEKNEAIKNEHNKIKEQYESILSQHEEDKNMFNSLLTTFKSKLNKKEREKSSLGEVNKYLNSLINNLDQKNIDLENSNDSMRRFKALVRNSSALKCKGCEKTYPTALFTPHVSLWPKLEQNETNSCSKENNQDLVNQKYEWY